MTDMLFRRPRYVTGDPPDLVFGAEDGTTAPPADINITAVFGPPVLAAMVLYDNKLPRVAAATAAFRHQAARPAAATAQAPWGRTQEREAVSRTPWQAAAPRSATPAVRWHPTAPRERTTRTAWQAAAPLDQALQATWEYTSWRDRLARTAWQQASQKDLQLTARHQVASGANVDLVLRHQVARPSVVVVHHRHRTGHLISATLLVRWQSARPPPPGLTIWVPPGTGEPPPREIVMDMLFACPPYQQGAPVDLLFGNVCGVGPVEPGETIVVPIRSVYMTFNTMLLRRVAGDITLPASGFSMSIDVDSWTWNWSATVQGAALELLAPEADEPVELEVVINSVPYRLLAEDVARTRRFGESSLSVSGRGLAAAIDEPYAPVLNFGNTEALTAQQIAVAALTLNGVGIGWEIEWGLTDWLVPAGAWSHQGTYISAINAIAAAAGGYVQPHATAKTLRVMPRYPAAPWNWGGITPDFELPSAPVVVEGIQWVKKPDYNRIYVSGQGQGVLGRVTRTGTAGDVEKPMVVDPLITHADAARQRGIRELSDAGSQAMVSLSLPVLSETGLILPGRFVKYVDGAADRLGIVRSTSLDWQRPRLRQSITLETHVEA